MKAIAWQRKEKTLVRIPLTRSELYDVKSMGWGVLRIPLLPYDVLKRNVMAAEELLDLAIKFESQSLYVALSNRPKDAQKRARMRYKIRACSRSTPQGPWASVAWIQATPNTFIRATETQIIVRPKEHARIKKARYFKTRYGYLVITGLRPPFERILLPNVKDEDEPEAFQQLGDVLEEVPVSIPILTTDSGLASFDTDAIKIEGRLVNVEGGLGEAVFPVAESVAQVLLQLSPVGRKSLDNIRQWVSATFGERIEMPINQLIERGDIVALYEPNVQEPNNKSLLELAYNCAVERQNLELTDEILRLIAPTRPQGINVPGSVELYTALWSQTPEKIDRGEFSLEVTPIGMSPWAGRSMGRILRSFPGPIDWARYYSEHTGGEYKAVELCALPSERSLWSLVPHQGILNTCLWLLPYAEPADRDVLRIEDISLVYENARFRLIDNRSGQQIVLIPFHMVSRVHMPLFVSLLLDLSSDSFIQPRGFNWGVAETFKYLPRVTRGKAIIRPAQWTLTVGELLNRQKRDSLGIPSLVALRNFDQRPIIDLDIETQVDAMFGSNKSNQLVTVQETFSSAWVEGLLGKHLNEIVFPLEIHSRNQTQKIPITLRSTTKLQFDIDWRWVSLFLRPSLLGVEHILDYVIEDILRKEKPVSWFFVRYISEFGEPEIRLRMGYRNDYKMTSVWEELKNLVDRGDLRDFEIRPYRPENGRWGVLNQNAVHRLFQIQSEAVLSARKLRDDELDSCFRMMFATAIQFLGLENTLQWLSSNRPSHEISLYKDKKTVLLSALRKDQKTQDYIHSLANIHLVDDGVPQKTIIRVLFHLCFNRFVGINPSLERDALDCMHLAAQSFLRQKIYEERQN